MSPFLARNGLVLAGRSLLAITLIGVRGRPYGRRVHPMLWNLLLAWVRWRSTSSWSTRPTASTTPLRYRPSPSCSSSSLFLPNSSYLIAELAHLREPGEEIPSWYDVIAALSLTMRGVPLCCVSLAYVHLILGLSVVGTAWSWVIVGGYLVLANFGIYVGRQLRFDSWDAIVRPGRVLARTGRHLFAEGALAEATGYTLVFTAFTLCVYLVVALPLLA